MHYKHREVVLFACGLMSDPTPLVDHVYQKWINAYLEGIPKGEYDRYDEYGEYRYEYDTDLLEALYAESNVQLPGSALHNNNINYYKDRKISSYTQHVYTPSKMYVFLYMTANVFCKFYKSEQEANIPECTMMIRSPNEAVSDSLLVACKQISKYQPIVDMRMFDVSWKYHPDLSENAHSLVLQSSKLPLQPLNHLIHKLSQCNKIRKIDLRYTNLENLSSLTLGNKTSLTHLDLAELCKGICRQLSDITHMEYLNMPDNDLTQVSKFTLNNKKTLRYLNLTNTHMPLSLYHTICEQLTDLKSLEIFCVSVGDFCYGIYDEHSPDYSYGIDKHSLTCNLSVKHLPPHVCRRVVRQINRYSSLRSIKITKVPLTGCVSSFLPDPHPGLPELEQLRLKSTALNKEDLQHLFSIIQSNKIPKVYELDLSGNTLTGCLSSFLPDPHPGLPALRWLDLQSTTLNKEDLQHLLSVVYKLPNLWELDLSQNTLTGCLSGFLSDPHPGLHELRYLPLKYTALNKDDLQHLLSVAYKLPKLHKLDLSGYTLTRCLSSFLTDPHPGLDELEGLNLRSTTLNKDDLQHLFSIIQLNKLPKLRSLNLSLNTLRGCLSSFLTDTHPGFSELKWLYLIDTALNKEDLCHLLSTGYKLPQLHKLDLSENTLTGYLSSFLSDPGPGLPELEELNLRYTALNMEDLQQLSHITQSKKLPKLQELDLSQNTLMGFLSRFLPDPHPGLPKLEKLNLSSTTLNEIDLQHLTHIIQSNKLPKLRKVDLSENTLTRCLSRLLPNPHPGLPELEELRLKSTALNKDDLQHLFNIIQSNKIPKVYELDLSGNTLTGRLSSFLPDPHPGLPELDELHLRNTDLNKEDLQHFSYIIQKNKLPDLLVLDLSENTLTGHLSSFLPDPHPGLPEVLELHLTDTAVNKDDLQHLKHLVQYGKLPKLSDLYLERNELFQMKEELRDLVETCITRHRVYLRLCLADNDLPEEFESQLKQCCDGIKICVTF